jgi:hypothetical protein
MFTLGGAVTGMACSGIGDACDIVGVGPILDGDSVDGGEMDVLGVRRDSGGVGSGLFICSGDDET